jgi:transcriptional regulator with XRE-family HTH domain
MTTTRVSEQDTAIGQKLRLRRNMLGLSQMEVAEKVGVSFQQLQKYEKGTNRVGAARLNQLAKILGIEVNYFFGEEIKMVADSASSGLTTIEFNDDVSSLIKQFTKISKPEVRKKVIRMVKLMSESEA